MKGLEGMSYEDSLKTLTSLEKRRLRYKLLALHSFLRQGAAEGGADLFSLGPSDRTYQVGIAQSCIRGRLDWTLGSIFTDRMVEH